MVLCHMKRPYGPWFFPCIYTHVIKDATVHTEQAHLFPSQHIVASLKLPETKPPLFVRLNVWECNDIRNKPQRYAR